MYKKGFLMLGVFLFAIFAMSGCNIGNSAPPQQKVVVNSETSPTAFSLSDNGAVWLDATPYKAFTIGNHSYITLNSCDDSHNSLFDKSGVYPPHYIISAFEALTSFEKAHPELHITRWEMEINRPSNYDRSSDKLENQLSCLRGIIIDHEPRK